MTVLHLILGNALHQRPNLRIRLLHLVLIVHVLVLVCDDLLEAVVLDLLIVQKQVLDLGLEVALLMRPVLSMFIHQIVQLLSFFTAETLLSLELFLFRHEVTFGRHQCPHLLLHGVEVFLKRVELDLLVLQTLSYIFNSPG